MSGTSISGIDCYNTSFCATSSYSSAPSLIFNGSTWQPTNTGTTDGLFGVNCSSDDDCIAVGRFGDIVGYSRDLFKPVMLVNQPDNAGLAGAKGHAAITSDPGTFAYALANAGPGDVITFQLAEGDTVQLAAPLPPVPDGVTIWGDCKSGSTIVLDGSQLAKPDQLMTFVKSATLKGLQLSGLTLSSNHGPVKLACVTVKKT
jgi:hypothetical protein